MRHDMQEWVLRRCLADAGQPVAVKLKVPQVSGAGIYGKQVVWADGSPPVGAGQPETITVVEKQACNWSRKERPNFSSSSSSQ